MEQVIRKARNPPGQYTVKEPPIQGLRNLLRLTDQGIASGASGPGRGAYRLPWSPTGQKTVAMAAE